MIDAIDSKTLTEASSRKGPRTEKTEKAQEAVQEFLDSGAGACRVDWKEITDDYDAAKRVIAYRISYSKEQGLEGARDLCMRSSRKDGEIYLAHADEL